MIGFSWIEPTSFGLECSPRSSPFMLFSDIAPQPTSDLAPACRPVPGQHPGKRSDRIGQTIATLDPRLKRGAAPSQACHTAQRPTLDTVERTAGR